MEKLYYETRNSPMITQNMFCIISTDKKKYEINTCISHKSIKACIGILITFCIDLLQLWLSVSILASWILPSNKYMFPTPSIPIRPAAVLTSLSSASGNASSDSPLNKYGINVGPMIISWLFRYGKGKVEYWVGKVLAKKMRKDQKKVRKEEKKREKEREEKERLERKEQRRKRREERKRQEEIKKKMEMDLNNFAEDDKSSIFDRTNNSTNENVDEQQYTDFNELD